VLWTSPEILAGLVALSVVGLLWSIKAESALWHAIFKSAASTFFLAVALASSALDSRYGTLIFSGLVLSWFGDVLLIPKGAGAAFKAGALSFLAGHVAYATAFVTLGLDTTSLLVAVIVVAVFGLTLLPRIRAGVPQSLSAVVLSYMVVISLMLILAAGAAAATSTPVIFVGALLFYLSDLAVARERFFSNEFINKLVGLPTYYLAQVVLALSCAHFV
jgi:uncharacterized membrane protein YhhN